MRYTNAVFAEAEAGLPPGWEPVNAHHFGHCPGENSVTVFTATGAANVQRRGVGKETPMEEALQGLARVELPSCWSQLLAEAEDDLGAGGDACLVR